MASRTLSTDEEGIIAVLKLAGYGVRYSVHLWRWMLYESEGHRTILSDINKHQFFKSCMSYLGQGEIK